MGSGGGYGCREKEGGAGVENEQGGRWVDIFKSLGRFFPGQIWVRRLNRGGGGGVIFMLVG